MASAVPGRGVGARSYMSDPRSETQWQNLLRNSSVSLRGAAVSLRIE